MAIGYGERKLGLVPVSMGRRPLELPWETLRLATAFVLNGSEQALKQAGFLLQRALFKSLAWRSSTGR
jgi:hypothetical protein